MSSESTIDYEALTQDALRGIVRRVLEQTIRYGLPGDHHFYISFDTLAPGVILSKRLREKYAEEMTIVLQHRFWDLAIDEDYFEVKLTFDGIPERLVVPFTAIKVFFDPSVRYGLQFESVDVDQGERSPSVMVERGDLEPSLMSADQPKRDLSLQDDALKKQLAIEYSAQDLGKIDTETELLSDIETGAAELKQRAEKRREDTQEDQTETGQSAEIVILDAFRKK